MRTTNLPLKLLVLLCSALFGLVLCSGKYCGVALGTGLEDWKYWDTGNVNNILRQIKETKSDTIQITTYIRQVGVNSTKVFPKTDDRAAIHAIRLCKAAGYKVFLKPVIDLVDDNYEYVWRGRIHATKRWFNKAYNPYIIKMARIAQQENVEVFAIGSELKETLRHTYYWKLLAKRVRKVYKGEMTYIANFDAFEKVHFWKSMDFIAISAYFRLVKSESASVPGLKRTKALFEKKVKKIQRWRRREGLNHMDMLVAEVGFQSKGGIMSYYTPWDWDSDHRVSNSAQVKMYEAFTSAFMSVGWNMGAIFWHWDFDMNAGKTHSRGGYTPQNKPARFVLRRKFSKYC